MEKVRDPRLAAAAALAIVTLGVFGTFRDYGPESAVRRFHHGVVTGDDREIGQVVSQPVGSTAVQELKQFVQLAMSRGGAQYRIETSKRTDQQVDMLALYGAPRIVWVVVKEPDRWRIDPYLTLQSLRRLGS